MPARGVIAEIDGLIGIDEEAIGDGTIVSIAGDAPGIGNHVGSLLGIQDNQSSDLGYRVQRDERGAVGVALTFRGEEDAALIVFIRAGGHGGRGFVDTSKDDARRDAQMAGDVIFAGGQEDPASVVLLGSVEGFLDRGSIVRPAVAFGAGEGF